MTSPLDYGPGLTATLVPFIADDGMALNLIHVRGAHTPTRGPVVLVHGAGVRANIFNPPLPMTFVRHLIERDYDVWLENWRASIDLALNEWTLDEAAAFDHPAAVRKICEMTGASTCKAVIHCQGSTSFTLATLSGLLPQVNLIVSNAVSLHTLIPDNARTKLLHLVPWVARLTPYLDPRWGEYATGAVPKMLQSWVRVRHRECDNGVCRFSSFTYGAGHPTLWPHENLSPEVHDWIRGEFADVPLSFFLQMRRCVQQGSLQGHGLDSLVDDNPAARAPATSARFVLIAGAINDCFLAESQRRTFEWLESHQPGRHSLHVIPGYGHLDVFIGKNAWRETYPLMSTALE